MCPVCLQQGREPSLYGRQGMVEDKGTIVTVTDTRQVFTQFPSVQLTSTARQRTIVRNVHRLRQLYTLIHPL